MIKLDAATAPETVRLSIEVLNLSAFPITVDEIGMTTKGKNRMVFTGAQTGDKRSLPLRIESREAVTLYTIPYLTTEFALAGNVFADTACGSRQLGRSPAINSLRETAVHLRQSKT